MFLRTGNHRKEVAALSTEIATSVKDKAVGAITAFLTSSQSFLHFDCTEGRISQRGQDAQVVRVKGDPQERSHGHKYRGHLLSDMDKHSVTLVTFICNGMLITHIAAVHYHIHLCINA